MRTHRWKLLAALGALLVALSLFGFLGPLSERFMLAFDHEKHRPLLLHFGERAPIGPCFTRETDDPESDILANILDLDGDGRGDFRLSAHYLGKRTTCEARRFGLWFDRPMAACSEAANSCQP